MTKLELGNSGSSLFETPSLERLVLRTNRATLGVSWYRKHTSWTIQTSALLGSGGTGGFAGSRSHLVIWYSKVTFILASFLFTFMSSALRRRLRGGKYDWEVFNCWGCGFPDSFRIRWVHVCTAKWAEHVENMMGRIICSTYPQHHFGCGFWHQFACYLTKPSRCFTSDQLSVSKALGASARFSLRHSHTRCPEDWERKKHLRVSTASHWILCEFWRLFKSTWKDHHEQGGFSGLRRVVCFNKPCNEKLRYHIHTIKRKQREMPSAQFCKPCDQSSGKHRFTNLPKRVTGP